MSIGEHNKVHSSPRRILHFIESGGVYGAERVILNLSREMIRNSELIPVVGCIVSTRSEQSDLFDAAVGEGIEAVKFVIPNSRVPLVMSKVVEKLKRMNVVLIHSHGYKPSVYGFLLKKLSGIPVIATCHLWFEMNKGPLKTRILIALEKYFYRWFPCVVAVSDDIRNELIANGVPDKKVKVIENGVSIEPNDASDQSALLRRSLGLGVEDFCVLNAGRLTRQKAQWILVEAASILKMRRVDIKVLIAGEGELKDSLMEQIVQLGVEDRVKLLGFRKDIPALLAMSDVFALPSLDEGMPMILLESAARGLPAIATAVGDIPKLICSQETGLVIPKDDPKSLADAIESLLRDAALREKLARNARLRMEGMYSSRSMYQKYSGIYQNLISGVLE